MKDTTLAIFEGKQIRKSFHNDEWWFVVNDVIDVLTDSKDSAQYFKRLKIRDKELAELIDQGGGTFCTTPYAGDRNGGLVAGRTRRDIELRSGKKVATRKHYLGGEKKAIRKLKETL